MPITTDTIPTLPDAFVDLGPLELAAGYWGLVGLIPYDGHVVLAVVGPPGWEPTRS